MSTPPPGYNPGESLLAGGTAQIHPVQGGGGPESVSLLSGGEEVRIEPVQGGGRGSVSAAFRGRRKGRKSSRSRSRTKSRSRSRSRHRRMQHGGAGTETQTTVTLTAAEPKIGPPSTFSFKEEIKPMPTSTSRLTTYSSTLKANIPAYINQMKLFWRRFTMVKGVGGESTDVAIAARTASRLRMLSPDSCPLPRDTGNPLMEDLFNYDRLAYILPKATQTIYIYPPIRGNTKTFQSIQQFWLDTLKPNTVHIFSPPFYYDGTNINDLNDRENRELLSQILRAKRAGYSVFVPPQHTTQNISVGCALDPQYEYGNQNSQQPLLNFLEPSYFIVPGPITDNTTPNGSTKGGIIITVSSPPLLKSSGQFASVSDALSASSFLSKTIVLVPKPGNDQDEDTNIKNAEVYLLPPSKIKDTSNILQINVTKQVASREERIQSLRLKFDVDESLRAKDFPIQMLKAVKFGKLHYIRDPSMLASAYSDWLEGKYTKDEAEVLTELQLSPPILEEIFPNGDWRLEVAEFFRMAIQTDCFDDLSVSLQNECDKTLDFLNKIHDYRIIHHYDLLALNEKNSKLIEDMLLRESDEAAALAKKRMLDKALLDMIAAISKGDFKLNPQDPVPDDAILATTDKASIDVGTIYEDSNHIPIVVDLIRYTEEGPQETRRVFIKKPSVDSRESLEDRLKNLNEKNKGAYFFRRELNF